LGDVRYLDAMTEAMRGNAVEAVPPVADGGRPDMQQARQFFSKIDEHLDLCRSLTETRDKLAEENRKLAARVQELGRDLHSVDQEKIQWAGKAASLEEQLAAKPRDEIIAALEDGLKSEGKRAKDLELELNTFLEERRSVQLETSRVSRAETKAAAAEAQLSQSEKQKEILRKQLLYAKNDLAPGDSLNLLDESEKENNADCAQS